MKIAFRNALPFNSCRRRGLSRYGRREARDKCNDTIDRGGNKIDSRALREGFQREPGLPKKCPAIWIATRLIAGLDEVKVEKWHEKHSFSGQSHDDSHGPEHDFPSGSKREQRSRLAIAKASQILHQRVVGLSHVRSYFAGKCNRLDEGHEYNGEENERHGRVEDKKQNVDEIVKRVFRENLHHRLAIESSNALMQTKRRSGAVCEQTAPIGRLGRLAARKEELHEEDENEQTKSALEQLQMVCAQIRSN